MSNRVALVTGAASGAGREVAKKFARTGVDLCLVDIDGAGLDQAAKEFRKEGVRALVQAVDLSAPDRCAAVVSVTLAEFGRLDALCNLAAVMLPNHSTEVKEADFQKTLAVNLSAPFFLMQAAIPHLLATQGAIVNVASAVGITAQAYNAAYCASKAGLIHMTRSMAMEYIHQPIRINAVAPGGMMTPLALNMMSLENTDPQITARTTPLRGLVEVEDVADMVVFLASDAASGYHGACVVIDKGMCAG